MTTSVSGITLLHAGGYRPGGWLGQLIDIAVGCATDYALVVQIERKSDVATLRFANPLSFRVQDERDLMDYWFARDAEGVAVGALYTVGRSPYAEAFRATISGQTLAFTHDLVAGDDLCVEVLSATPPELPAGWSTGWEESADLPPSPPHAATATARRGARRVTVGRGR